MADIIVGLIVALILFGAIRFIYKEKKKGRHCIGCPSSGSCNGCCSGSSNSTGCLTNSENSKK